jgi:predicted nucleic acid-binding protein
MVLVDTSVWIKFLLNRSPHAAAFEQLLVTGQVVGHELVYGELLIGDRGGRRKLLHDYRYLSYARSVPHDDVVAFVEARGLHGRGAGWPDIHLLASAIVEKIPLWTADSRLAVLAAELGVAYPFLV